MAMKFHIAMSPWFARDHVMPFLPLANKLAQKGHKISFIITIKIECKLRHLNHHPDLTSFNPITVPAADDLSLGSETTADLSGFHQVPLLMTAMDQTQPKVNQLLHLHKPNIIFLDLTHWTVDIATEIGAKAIHYYIISTTATCYLELPSQRKQLEGKSLQETESALMKPLSKNFVEEIKLHVREAIAMAVFGSNVSIGDLKFFDQLDICHTK